MISVLLPSRGRVYSLLRSVHSLREHATLPDKLEILVGYDSDDQQTGQMARSQGCQAVEFQRQGYSKLHVYVNELTALAAGQWLLLWNDDATMLTSGWDSTVRLYDSRKPQVLSLSSTGFGHDLSCFPVVSAVLPQLLGHWSLSPHCDTWMQDIGREARCYQELPIEVYHDRFDLTGGHFDQTWREGQAGYQSKDYYGPKLTEARKRDIAKVRAALRANPLETE